MSKIQIQTVVYRVYFRGRQFAMPLSVSTGAKEREKVLIRRKKK